MKRYIVTGSDGFIGKRLVERLAREHHVVSIPSLEVMRRYFGVTTVDGVFHMGAISSTTETDMRLLMDHNVNPTDQIYQWCSWNEVPLVYASSGATYGHGAENEALAFSDDMFPAELAPLNNYGWSKNEADQRVTTMHDWGINPPHWAGVKMFNVYGGDEESKGDQASFVYKAIKARQRGEPIKIFRQGKSAKRDFVHVDDAIEAMIWLMDSSRRSGLYNIGTGEAVMFGTVAALVASAMPKESGPPMEVIDMPREIVTSYQHYTCADIARLRGAGYTGKFRTIEEGIKDTVKELT